MMVSRKVTAGSGITAHELTIHDEPLTPERFRELIGTGRPSFAKRVARLAVDCRHIVDHPDEFDRNPDDPGLQWYDDRPSVLAGRILDLIEHIGGQIEKGDADMVARLTLGLGQDVAKLSMKLTREPDYVRGIATLEGSEKGHQKVHGTEAEKQKRWERIYKDLQAELGRGTKKMAAYALVAERHSVHTKTVMRVQKRIEKS